MSAQRGGSAITAGPRCSDCGHDLRYVGDKQTQANNMHHQRMWLCGNDHCSRDSEVVVR